MLAVGRGPGCTAGSAREVVVAVVGSADSGAGALVGTVGQDVFGKVNC